MLLGTDNMALDDPYLYCWAGRTEAEKQHELIVWAHKYLHADHTKIIENGELEHIEVRFNLEKITPSMEEDYLPAQCVEFLDEVVEA